MCSDLIYYLIYSLYANADPHSFWFLPFGKVPSWEILANFVVRLESNQNRGF